jgi:membrane protease YdiL (CAAX protease family)
VRVATAWAFVLIGTLFPVIVMRAVLGQEPSWLVPLQFAILVGFLGATFVSDRLRGLRVFALVLLAGQLQILVDWSTVARFLDVTTSGFWAWTADRAVSFLFAVALLAVLLGTGYGRDDLFLRRGDLGAAFEPIELPGLSEPWPWRWYALRWGGGIVLVTVVVTALQGGRFWLVDLSAGELAVVVPVILAMAAANAFSEEFLYRAAPLSELATALGKHQALLLLGTVFGINHYYGTPDGLAAVVLGVFLGWFLGKSVLETRGIGFALGLHVLLDVVVFTSF